MSWTILKFIQNHFKWFTCDLINKEHKLYLTLYSVMDIGGYWIVTVFTADIYKWTDMKQVYMVCATVMHVRDVGLADESNQLPPGGWIRTLTFVEWLTIYRTNHFSPSSAQYVSVIPALNCLPFCSFFVSQYRIIFWYLCQFG